VVLRQVGNAAQPYSVAPTCRERAGALVVPALGRVVVEHQTLDVKTS